MKRLLLLAILFFLNTSVFCQWEGNENPLTIKELKLTRPQKNKIRKINADALGDIKKVEKSATLNEASSITISKIKGRRIKRIRSSLTPAQRVAWKEKMMEKRPRRGVTSLPNERAVK